MLTIMHWMLWLVVLASHLGLASLGNVTATAAEVMPSSNSTDFVDVTAQSGDVTESIVSQDGAATENSISSASMETILGLRNVTNVENAPIEITTAEDLQNTESYLRVLKENSGENGTSITQTDETTAVKPSTVKPFLSASSSDSTGLTTNTFDEAVSTVSTTNTFYSQTSFTKTSTDETLQEPAATSKPTSFYTHVDITTIPTTKTIKDVQPTSPVSQVSKTSLNSSRPILQAITNVTSSSPVPMASHFSGTARSNEAQTTSSSLTFEVFRQTKVTGSITEDDNLQSTPLTVQTTPPKVQPTSAEFMASTTKATQSIPYTQPVTEEVTTITDDDDVIEDDDQYKDGESSHVETAYERSLRTRRVINHAALWITIGFVVVLVTYITILVIYNRMRPDWQDSQHPYSRFENEPEDFQDINENNRDCESQGLIEDHQQFENRRDFSQCVDPRDFPPCEGSNEHLLYEDPTYIDDDTCTDFTYRDQC